MKTRSDFIRRAVLLLIVLMGMPAAANAAIHIKLAVDSDTRLVVTENDSPCANGPIDCIEVAKGTSPNLFFDLENACKSNGPQYRLARIRIAMAEKDWPGRSNPLPHHVADDFYADRYNGVIDLIYGNGGSNDLKNDRIKLKDKNDTAYTVYYEIAAQQCNGSGVILLDPSVRNGGK